VGLPLGLIDRDLRDRGMFPPPVELLVLTPSLTTSRTPARPPPALPSTGNARIARLYRPTSTGKPPSRILSLRLQRPASARSASCMPAPGPAYLSDGRMGLDNNDYGRMAPPAPPGPRSCAGPAAVCGEPSCKAFPQNDPETGIESDSHPCLLFPGRLLCTGSKDRPSADRRRRKHRAENVSAPRPSSSEFLFHSAATTEPPTAPANSTSAPLSIACKSPPSSWVLARARLASDTSFARCLATASCPDVLDYAALS